MLLSGSILYFDFKHHNIPINSNIVNIVLHTTKFYNKSSGSPYEPLRIYCGKILAELFNTNLDPGYNAKFFKN